MKIDNTAMHRSIKGSILGHFMLYGLLGLFITIQATMLARQPNDIPTSYDRPLQKCSDQMQSVPVKKTYWNNKKKQSTQDKAASASPLPLDQFLIPANGQCLYTSVIMGYLLPVRQKKDKMTERINQLFGPQPDYYLNQLHKTLQSFMHILTYLHSDIFSTLVIAFISHMEIKKSTWGGPEEMQTIANKLNVNIQVYYPDPNNPTSLLKSLLVKSIQANTDTTLHIVRDRVHPTEIFTQAEKALTENSLHHQHYRLKYTLSSSLEGARLASKKHLIPYRVGSRQKNQPYSVDDNWFKAAKTGKLEWLTVLYSKSDIAIVNTKNKNQDTALHLSAKKGYLGCVRYLLEQGADINIRDKWGSTALHLSAKKGHLNCVKYLVEQGVDINTSDRNKETALLLSVRSRHIDCVTYLVEQGANIHVKDKRGYTAFIWSAKKGYLGCVKYLLKQGADIHIKDRKGSTVLLLSAENGHIDCVKYLLQQGSDINASDKWGSTALLKSVQSGHLDCVKLLLQQGVNIYTRDRKEKTALHLSAENGRVDCVKYLLQQGADINTRDRKRATALHLSAENGHVDCVKYLLQQGSDIHDKNEDGDTALILSVYKGDLACVKYLLQQGANITLKSKENKTALQWAKEKGEKDIVNYLSTFKQERFNLI